MKPKPILFSTPMVQAILEGRKTMTRRIMKPQPVEGWMDNTKQFSSDGKMFDRINKKQLFWIEGENDQEVKPKYQPRDILWVRETWVKGCEWDGDSEMPPLRYYYRADEDWKGKDWHDEKNDCTKAEPTWKPSIFMPFEAARIFLEVTNVRVERLQDISEEDAMAEGIIEFTKDGKLMKYSADEQGAWSDMPRTAKKAFEFLWESINGPESWEANPWVFVYEFKRVEKQ
jgi:hypothetical protein